MVVAPPLLQGNTTDRIEDIPSSKGHAANRLAPDVPGWLDEHASRCRHHNTSYSATSPKHKVLSPTVEYPKKQCSTDKQ